MATANFAELTKTFGLLQHPYRRHVLTVLTTEAGVAGIETLAASITEAGVRSDAGAPQTVEQVRISLHHVHLPKLADSGVVTYDPETETAELTDQEEVVRLLDDAAAVDGDGLSLGGD